MTGIKETATLIAGPTASGKSDLALCLAKQHDAIIINADSMQVYDVLDVLTARPDASALAKAPHFLYGTVNPAISYSTGQWLRDVKKILGDHKGREKIFVGGTGLYFSALTGGLAIIPDIPDTIRMSLRQEMADTGGDILYRRLEQVDPVIAARLAPHDSQRILRALEVYKATGKSLLYWQAQKEEPVIDPEQSEKIALMPERTLLYDNINRRFDSMVGKGALDEVKLLLDLHLPADLPVMKAIGVGELGAYLAGSLSVEEAIDRAKQQTRHYAKRQMTWFRNQLDEHWQRIGSPADLLK